GDRARRESPRRVSRRAERRHPTSGYVARGKARRVPLTRATVRAVAVTLVLALCALYAIAAPARGQEHFVDEAINRVTVEHMRHGANYYDAMDDSLRRYNGPAGSVRAYRLPTPFLLWRALGSVRAIWLFYVLLVAIG